MNRQQAKNAFPGQKLTRREVLGGIWDKRYKIFGTDFDLVEKALLFW